MPQPDLAKRLAAALAAAHARLERRQEIADATTVAIQTERAALEPIARQAARVFAHLALATFPPTALLRGSVLLRPATEFKIVAARWVGLVRPPRGSEWARVGFVLLGRDGTLASYEGNGAAPPNFTGYGLFAGLRVTPYGSRAARLAPWATDRSDAAAFDADRIFQTLLECLERAAYRVGDVDAAARARAARLARTARPIWPTSEP